MLEYSGVGRRIATRSTADVLHRSLQAQLDSEAILRRVAARNAVQGQLIAYYQETIRQCREACDRAKQHLPHNGNGRLS